MTKTSAVVPFADLREDTTRTWDIFRLQRKILLGFGIWPADRLVRRWYVKLLIGINMVTLAICMVGEFMHGLYSYLDGDLSEAIETVGPTVARISGLLRMVFFLAQEQEVNVVLDSIRHILRYEHPREHDTTSKLMYMGQQITFYIFLTSVFTASFFGLTPLVFMAYNWFQGQDPVVKLLAFKIALPFDSQNSLYFTLTTIFLNYASLPTITALGSDTLFIGICVYLYGQLTALKLELETLSATIEERSLRASLSEAHRVNQELRRITKRHQDIVELVCRVRSAFAPIVLLVYTSTAFAICIVCVAMIVVEGIQKLTYFPYTITLLTSLFLNSYGGTVIRDSAEIIQKVAYDFPWYRFDRDTRHIIQMMMVRSQHGSNLDVPFYETSLNSFSMIVRTALSYITLMKSFL